MQECAELTQAMLTESGLDAEIIPLNDGPPVVYAERRAPNATQTIVIYDHYDVQPAEPWELWDSDPWAGEIRDGKLYARGAADNKGNIISRLAAIEAFLEAHGELPCHVKFVIEGEEETGSPHFASFIHAHKDRLTGDAAIWEFGGLDYDDVPGVTLGLKGMLYVELFIRTIERDAHSARAAIAPNPAWRLLKAIDTLSDGHGHITVEGWYDNVRDFTDGELEALQAEPLQEERLKRELGLDEFLNGMSGLELKKALTGAPTANVAGFYAGYIGEGHKTVLPSYASAKMDFRLVPDQDPDRLADRLRHHLAERGFDDVELTIQSENPAARTPLDARIAQVARETAEEVWGQAPNVHVGSAGSGPMHLFTSVLGLPTVAIGCNHPETNTHAPNENQRIDALVGGAKWIAAVLGRFSAQSESTPGRGA
jgi:acetylornithine deacetylase/succinyl-diaminopimelate desuccinylase-like protein